LDWHKADIKAALEKAGWTLRALSFSSGYTSSTLRHALRGPYPKAEQIIANAIGVAPELIWPTRYNEQGKPNRNAGKKPNSNCSSRKSTQNSAQGKAA